MKEKNLTKAPDPSISLRIHQQTKLIGEKRKRFTTLGSVDGFVGRKASSITRRATQWGFMSEKGSSRENICHNIMPYE